MHVFRLRKRKLEERIQINVRRLYSATAGSAGSARVGIPVATK